MPKPIPVVDVALVPRSQLDTLADAIAELDRAMQILIKLKRTGQA